MKRIFLYIFLCSTIIAFAQTPVMVDIPAGDFYMGSRFEKYPKESLWKDLYPDADENPIHKVSLSSFRMSETEITNAQYELFDPSHRALRGYDGFSTKDDEAVVMVSYYDAVAYCRWLSEREGKNYRLPTEAEWEYACKAGCYDPFNTGAKPKFTLKSQFDGEHYEVVPLTVKSSKPNKFDLYDMHGNVEEWCSDWYGPYSEKSQINPSGPLDGEFKVTRSGSHGTAVRYLRSTNRLAALPADRSVYIGFRVVESDINVPQDAKRQPHPATAPKKARPVLQSKTTQQSSAFFATPIPYISFPDEDVPMFGHNHCPAIVACPNGDLLVCWFSTDSEFGREMTILSSRLCKGAKQWTKPELFYKVPDRNMTGSALYYDEQNGRLIHLNGVESVGWWRNLAVVRRYSYDSGKTWTKGELVLPEHALGHQIIAGMKQLGDGTLVCLADADPGMEASTAMLISHDNGETWEMTTSFGPLDIIHGGQGNRIAGIHAALVQLTDGSLMALGRTREFKDGSGRACMPKSISYDGGHSWQYSETELPPIGGGQRLVLLRLQEGPLMLVSFSRDQNFLKGTGAFVALSYDEGLTWPKRKLLTDGTEQMMDGGAWTGLFLRNAETAEPKGYMAGEQTPDGMIHIVSSRNYYKFNLKWIEE